MLRAEVRVSLGALDLDVAFETRSTTAVVGPNGAGKTTLLRALVGALPASGSIVLDDRTLLDSARGTSVPIERRRIAFATQRPLLFPHLDVRGNVEFARRHGAGRTTDLDLLVETFEVGSLLGRRVEALSAGEAQRVALVRALASSPPVVLLDEPFAAADVDVAARLRPRLRAHLATTGTLGLLVTHTRADLETLADEGILLVDGRVRGRFDPRAPVSADAHPFLAALLGDGIRS